MVSQRRLDARSTLTGKEACSHEDMMNQLVWHNKYILSNGKSLYRVFFHDTCGIGKVGDLVSKDTIFLGSEKNLQCKTNCRSIFPLTGSGQRHTE